MRNDNLPELLQMCRKRAGLKQDQLAAKLYIDQAIISKVESGKLQPSYTLVKQWAKATSSVDLLSLDFSGNDGWKKLKKLEETMEKMKDLVGSMSFMRLKVNARRRAR